MSWHQKDFEGEEGVTVMLRRLSASPLVRRSLPNAAAIMTEYFQFRRKPNESIAQFLVRETLGFEEFQEALLQLKEEKDGLDPSRRDFELPEITQSTSSELSGKGGRQGRWWGWRDWQEWRDHVPPEVEEEDHERPPTQADGYSEVPQESEGGDEAESPQIVRFPQSPHASRPQQSPHASRSPLRSRAAAVPSQGELLGPLAQTLSPMDTFILDVLRGWRLLMAASLTQEEWRDILASTGNKLDYVAISEALQTLWDEQLGGASGGRFSGSPSMFSHHWVEATEPLWHEQQAAWQDDSWWQTDGPDWSSADGWHESSYAQYSPVSEAQASMAENTATAGEADPEIQEALEAERAAEALAMDARRTWTQAQQATATLRRDRGFGKFSKGGVRWSLCSGMHPTSQCPDRQHPQFRKGGGKQMSQAELDAYLFAKGKNKGYGKTKSKDQFAVAWEDWQVHDCSALYKGKQKGKPSGKMRSTVNVYGMEYHMLEFQGLEMFPLELYASSELHQAPLTIPAGCGMLDCGATASAGPEASVKRMIGKLREYDSNLVVSLNFEKKPFFRYGSGRWGRALYQAEISSSQDPNRCFSVYALPNPDEYYEPNFKEYMLVPILVGMDYLAKVGLILDFVDGHAVHGTDPHAKPFNMKKNAKGHFMVDVAEYLFGISAYPEASAVESLEAAVHLQAGHGQGWLELAVLEDTVEVNVMTGQNVSEPSPYFSYLVDRRRTLMSQSSSAVAAVALQRSTAVHPSDPHEQAVIESSQEGEPLGSHSESGERPPRSSFKHIMLAVQRQSRSLHQWKQRFWGVGQVQQVCSKDRVCASRGCSSDNTVPIGSQVCGASSGMASEGASQGQDSMVRVDGKDLQHVRVGGQDCLYEVQGPNLGTVPSGLAAVPEDGSDYSAGKQAKGQQTSSRAHLGSVDPGGVGSCDEPGTGSYVGKASDGAGSGSRVGGSPITDKSLNVSGGEKRESAECDEEELGTSMPEFQIEQAPKKVQFSDPVAEVNSVAKKPSSSLSSQSATPLEDNNAPVEDMLSAEFELLKNVETQFCQQRSGGRSKKSTKNSVKKRSSFETSNSCVREMSEATLKSSPEKDSCHLPWRLGKALLTLMSLMLLTAQQELRTVLRGSSQVDVWEMFCAPDSWLSSACQEEGLRCSRINLHQNYDLYKASTYDELWDKFLRERPKRIWVSSRCTYWCPWTSLNYSTVEGRAQLNKYRRRERAMFRSLIPFLVRVVLFSMIPLLRFSGSGLLDAMVGQSLGFIG